MRLQSESNLRKKVFMGTSSSIWEKSSRGFCDEHRKTLGPKDGGDESGG